MTHQSARNNAGQAEDEATRASALAVDAAAHAREAIADVAHAADETLGGLATRVKDRIAELPRPAAGERATGAEDLVREKTGMRSRLMSRPVLLLAIAAVAFVAFRILRSE